MNKVKVTEGDGFKTFEKVNEEVDPKRITKDDLIQWVEATTKSMMVMAAELGRLKQEVEDLKKSNEFHVE